MKHRTNVGFAAAMALCLASCAATPQSGPANRPVTSSVQQEMPTGLVLSDGGKKAVVHSGRSTAPRVEAQLAGSLAADGAGCIIVRAKDGEDSTLVFPEGTSFKGESLLLPDGVALSDGDSVALQGARVPANENVSMCLNYARLFSVETASGGP